MDSLEIRKKNIITILIIIGIGGFLISFFFLMKQRGIIKNNGINFSIQSVNKGQDTGKGMVQENLYNNSLGTGIKENYIDAGNKIGSGKTLGEKIEQEIDLQKSDDNENNGERNLCGKINKQEIYDMFGDGTAITIQSLGLCKIGTVSSFNYNAIKHTWKWACISEKDYTDCDAKALWCGNGVRDISYGEMCDGGKDGYCSAGTLCDDACLCIPLGKNNPGDTEEKNGEDTKDFGETNNSKNILKETLCGSIDGKRIYDETGNGYALTVSGANLCNGVLPTNFIYNVREHRWSRSCDTISCSADSEWCGDGVLSPVEICDPKKENSCDDGSVCTNSCVCTVNVVDGICGEKDFKKIYDSAGKGDVLKAGSPGLCKTGKVNNFIYDDETSIRTWTCLNNGGGENAFCQAAQEICGDGITNGDEQCDDGNNAPGDGCSKKCLAESHTYLGPVTTEGCGNAVLDLGEQCDDGNLLDKDGCGKECVIEDGWKCTSDAPSQCGTFECLGHGEWYTQYNILGNCCGGLKEMKFEHIPEKLIGSGVQVTICYDDSIAEPLCLPNQKISGWYLPKIKGTKPKLITKDICGGVYKDYYLQIDDDLKKEHAYCQYDDEPYENVDFKDIEKNTKKPYIQAMLDFCIVKGPGTYFSYYRPYHRTTRAEFLKMLIKTLFIGYEYSVVPETDVLGGTGTTYYDDVLATDRFSQYVIKAHELGIVDVLVTKNSEGRFFLNPHKYITHDEVITIVEKLDVGQKISKDLLEEILGSDKYPERGIVSELLVRKFLDKFSEYFYFSGENSTYLKTLRTHLMGKKYIDQYMTIVRQINQLQKNENILENVVFFSNKKSLSLFWLVKYLKSLLY